ncbi:ATP-binding protein [Ureibacillus sp. 179-F W5.1 NHS]|nr:ATP-binding protein [Lysinibacillus halotolerans]
MEYMKALSKVNRCTIAILATALLTAIGSEIKIMPYEEAPFRFGLGSIIFFIAVLIRTVPVITTGIITGLTVVLFRSLLDSLFYEQPFINALIEHFPAALFYFSFAVCLSIFNIEKYKTKPLTLGLMASLFEIISNSIEHLFTTLFVTKIPINAEEIFLLITIALLRSFFVVGLYSSIIIAENKKQVQQLLNIGSNLYVETLYLQKSMNQIEQITASSFDLYKQLATVHSELSIKALIIAQEIHEVKKDQQRIFAGLSNIVENKQSDHYLMSDLLSLVSEANQKYSVLLKKNIQFNVLLNEDFHTHAHIQLLAVLNNLVANAVEAIENEGAITISVGMKADETNIIIEDNGIGIPEHSLPVIFDPGFTSKFNEKGEPSTGIGLSHVQAIVAKLHGNIHVESNKTTKFIITIPTNML